MACHRCCDTVSALLCQGKRRAFQLAQKEGLDFLDVFETSTSSKDDIARVGEQFLLKLYGARGIDTLDKDRYTCYNRSISRSSLSFKLASLPPTSAAAKQHSFRTYHSVQPWKGHQLDPTEFGWRIQDNTMVSV